MNKNNFMARIAKAAFALATVLTLSLAFTACGNNDLPTPPGPGPDPNPEPEKPVVNLDNAAMINSVEKKVDSVTMVKFTKDYYNANVYLEDGSFIRLEGYDTSDNGKPFDLKVSAGYWALSLREKGGKINFFVTFNISSNKCDRGTLLWTYDPDSNHFSIEVNDAHISAEGNTDGDKKDYSFALKWSGTPKKKF